MRDVGPPSRPPPSKAGRVILALSLLAFGAFALSVDGAAVMAQLAALGPGIAIILAPPLLVFLTQVLGWSSILRGLGHRPSLAKLASISLGTQAQRMALPGGMAIAEPTQIWILDRWCATGVEDALSSVTTKRVLTWLTNGFVGLIALAVWLLSPHATRELSLGLSATVSLAGATAVLLGSSVVVLVTMRTKRLLAAIHRTLARIPIRRMRNWLEATQQRWALTAERMAKAVDRPRALLVPSSWLFASWLVEATETWLLLTLLGRPLPWLDCLVIETLAALLKSLAFASPGGLGAQDLGYAVMLRAYGVSGAGELALAFVVVKRAKEALWTALGFAAMLTWPLKEDPAKND